MQRIVVVDYGSGNLRSVAKALERAGGTVEVSSAPGAIEAASGVVLPGVGAFRAAMENLSAGGWTAGLRAHLAADRPFLGICLGLQLLFDDSEEFGFTQGFGLVRGHVRAFPHPSSAATDTERAKVPHMGWNQLTATRRSMVSEAIGDGAWAYFVHSFYVDCLEPDVIATTTRHGDVSFTSSIERGRLIACQFHPEKSQSVGLDLLAKFVESCQ
ncbi:MAG: imidazole glycerol phosphate synthase subunit HisH [Deltaproteobacteria bacterium]|nr:imidazole glycerol phosphate synthase subunit HisH [Deltaproteobacteria bacterium]